MNSENHTVKQHYVPRAFLARWCNTNDEFYPIKIVSKKPAKLDILRKSGAYPFCHENYFYANEQGKKDSFSQKAEEMFTSIEAVMYDVLDSFEKKVIDNKRITFEDKEALAGVMLFLHLRGKKQIEHSKKLTTEMTRKIYGLHLKAKGDEYYEKIGLTKEDALRFNEEMSVDIGTAHHLKQLANLEEFAFHIAHKYWRINISKKGEFIVTDTPYLDLPVKQTGFWGNSIYEREQLFTFSPNIHISIVQPTSRDSKNTNRRDITNNPILVDRLNSLSLMNAVMFGFHSNEKILVRIKNYVDKVSGPTKMPLN